MSNKQEATFHDGKEPEVQVGVPCSHGYVIRYNGPRRAYQGHPIHQGTGTLCDDQPATATITPDPAYGVMQAWQPQGRPGQKPEDLDLTEWVGQALGAASACWSNLEGAGVFDSTQCGEVAKALSAHINGLFEAFIKEAEERRRLSDAYLREQYEGTIMHSCSHCERVFGRGPEALKAVRSHVQAEHSPKPTEPMLGLATTREMLRELQIRAQVPIANAWLENATKQALEVIPEHALNYRTAEPS